MESWATDIGNAYLEALTREKVCMRAGPKFGDLEGHLLIVYKALYGLQHSRKTFGQILQECLWDLGFLPSLVELLIHMRKYSTANHYEYIAIYVDDLAIIMKDPQEFINQLEAAPYNFELKGLGPLNFHLGCEFNRYTTGTLCMDPGKYIDWMEEAYVQHFGTKPVQKHRPLRTGYKTSS